MTPRLVGLEVGDTPAAWAALGFTVDGDRVGVGGITIRLVGDDGVRGIRGWQLAGSGSSDVEGLAAVEVPALRQVGAHSNGITAVDHVVVGTWDLERTTAALAGLGLTPRRTVDGARDARLTYRFFLLNTCVLEVIGPTVHDPTRTSRPASFVGLAFVAPDLGVGRRLGVTRAPRPAVQPGRDIATFDTTNDVSVPLAVLTPRPSKHE